MAIQERDFHRLMNQIRVQVPGQTDAGVKGVLFDVIDEFFDVSNAWTEWLNFVLAGGTQTYQLYPQHGGMINRLVTVLDVNRVVQPASITFGEIPNSGAAGTAYTYVAPPGVILTFMNPVNTTMTVNALVSKKIILPNNKDDIPDAPSWLLPLYARYLLEGTVGTLMMQRGKPYSDPERAAYHLKRFRDGMDMAKVATMRSNLLGGQAWRFPRDFRATSQRGGVSTPFPTPSGQGVF